jgi:histidinol-phosphate aminotransferase
MPLFGLSWHSQELAIRAIEAQAYYCTMAEDVMSVRDDFITKVRQLPFVHAYDSASNFVLVRSTLERVERMLERAREEGYELRDCSGYGMSDCVRVTLAPAEHMQGLVEVVSEVGS